MPAPAQPLPTLIFSATVLHSDRHENDPHAGRARDLALKLREARLTWSCGPVEENDKVVIVITPSDTAVYEGKAPPGVGVGAAIEARRIFQQL